MRPEAIKLYGKKFIKYISSEKIQAAVRQLSRSLNVDYQGLSPVFLPVLNGSFVFASDLIRKLNFQSETSFIKLASYTGTRTSGNIQTLIGLNTDIRGRHVLIIEDIVDTGSTLESIIEELSSYQPASLKVCTLLLKPGKYRKDFVINYVGLEIDDSFVVGYGMDYDNLGRNFTDIYKLKSL